MHHRIQKSASIKNRSIVVNFTTNASSRCRWREKGRIYARNNSNTTTTIHYSKLFGADRRWWFPLNNSAVYDSCSSRRTNSSDVASEKNPFLSDHPEQQPIRHQETIPTIPTSNSIVDTDSYDNSRYDDSFINFLAEYDDDEPTKLQYRFLTENRSYTDNDWIEQTNTLLDRDQLPVGTMTVDNIIQMEQTIRWWITIKARQLKINIEPDGAAIIIPSTPPKTLHDHERAIEEGAIAIHMAFRLYVRIITELQENTNMVVSTIRNYDDVYIHQQLLGPDEQEVVEGLGHWFDGRYPRATHLLNAILDAWRIVYTKSHATTTKNTTKHQANENDNSTIISSGSHVPIPTPEQTYRFLVDHICKVPPQHLPVDNIVVQRKIPVPELDCKSYSILMNAAANETDRQRKYDAPIFCESILNDMLSSSSSSALLLSPSPTSASNMNNTDTNQNNRMPFLMTANDSNQRIVGTLPDTVAFTIAFNAWKKSERLDTAQRVDQLFQEYIELYDSDVKILDYKTAGPNTILYNTVIEAIVKCGIITMQQKTNNYVHHSNNTALSYQQLIRAEELFHSMKQSPYPHVLPDTHSYRTMIFGWAELATAMKRHGSVFENEYDYDILEQRTCMYIVRAFELLKEALSISTVSASTSSKIDIDSEFFSILIGALVRQHGNSSNNKNKKRNKAPGLYHNGKNHNTSPQRTSPSISNLQQLPLQSSTTTPASLQLAETIYKYMKDLYEQSLSTTMDQHSTINPYEAINPNKCIHTNRAMILLYAKTDRPELAHALLFRLLNEYEKQQQQQQQQDQETNHNDLTILLPSVGYYHDVFDSWERKIALYRTNNNNGKNNSSYNDDKKMSMNNDNVHDDDPVTVDYMYTLRTSELFLRMIEQAIYTNTKRLLPTKTLIERVYNILLPRTTAKDVSTSSTCTPSQLRLAETVLLTLLKTYNETSIRELKPRSGHFHRIMKGWLVYSLSRPTTKHTLPTTATTATSGKDNDDFGTPMTMTPLEHIEHIMHVMKSLEPTTTSLHSIDYEDEILPNLFHYGTYIEALCKCPPTGSDGGVGSWYGIDIKKCTEAFHDGRNVWLLSTSQRQHKQQSYYDTIDDNSFGVNNNNTRHHRPITALYTSLFHAYARSGHGVEATKLLQLMIHDYYDCMNNGITIGSVDDAHLLLDMPTVNVLNLVLLSWLRFQHKIIHEQQQLQQEHHQQQQDEQQSHRDGSIRLSDAAEASLRLFRSMTADHPIMGYAYDNKDQNIDTLTGATTNERIQQIQIQPNDRTYSLLEQILQQSPNHRHLLQPKHWNEFIASPNNSSNNHSRRRNNDYSFRQEFDVSTDNRDHHVPENYYHDILDVCERSIRMHRTTDKDTNNNNNNNDTNENRIMSEYDSMKQMSSLFLKQIERAIQTNKKELLPTKKHIEQLYNILLPPATSIRHFNKQSSGNDTHYNDKSVTNNNLYTASQILLAETVLLRLFKLYNDTKLHELKPRSGHFHRVMKGWLSLSQHQQHHNTSTNCTVDHDNSTTDVKPLDRIENLMNFMTCETNNDKELQPNLYHYGTFIEALFKCNTNNSSPGSGANSQTVDSTSSTFSVDVDKCTAVFHQARNAWITNATKQQQQSSFNSATSSSWTNARCSYTSLYTSLLNAYARSGHGKEAMELIQLMNEDYEYNDRHNICLFQEKKPSIDVYNLVLLSWLRWQQKQQNAILQQQQQQQALNNSSVTIATATSTIDDCNNHAAEESLKLFHSMMNCNNNNFTTSKYRGNERILQQISTFVGDADDDDDNDKSDNRHFVNSTTITSSTIINTSRTVDPNERTYSLLVQIVRQSPYHSHWIGNLIQQQKELQANSSSSSSLSSSS